MIESLPPSLFDIPNPFLLEGAVARLLEPPESSRHDLSRRLMDGSYDKPFILDQAGRRHLYFNLRFLQSSMSLADPWALELPYCQRMMAFLLFNPHPRRLLLIGLGGGSLAKYCHRRLPGARVSAVELDPHILALRDAFLVPADDGRFTVIQGDGARFLQEADERWDAILVDAFDQHGVPEALVEPAFFEHALRRLTGRGILVMNVAGEKSRTERLMDAVERAFDCRVLTLTLRQEGNTLLFAFRDPDFAANWKWLRANAPRLEKDFGLDFPAFARQLERESRLLR